MSEQSPYNVIADDFNHIHMAHSVVQLSGNFPEVFQEQVVKLPLVLAEVSIPGLNVISVTVVKYYRNKQSNEQNLDERSKQQDNISAGDWPPTT